MSRYANPSFPPRLFVTGTDTEVGKTVAAALLTLGLRASYWKPIQAGFEPESDTQAVQRMTGLPDEHFFPETYRLQAPLSPHASAALEGLDLSLDAFALPETSPSSHCVVEGCGGCMVPLNQRGDLLIDLMARWKLPTLVVSRSGLGTLNHTFMTLEMLRRREIPLFGVLMNGEPNPSNRQAIERFGQVEVLGEIPPQKNLDPLSLQALFDQLFMGASV